MTKDERLQVFDKFGGRCAYCGDVLAKGWHVDHIEPIVRDITNPTECEFPERDCIENYNPSCASCNRMKGSACLEEFRRIIGQFINSMNQYHTQYKFAKRYGLITETRNPVVFYFETIKPQDHE